MDEHERYTASLAKDYFLHVCELAYSVRRLQERLDGLEAMAAGVSGVDYSKDKVAAQPARDRLEKAVAAMEELKGDYACELDACLKEQRTAWDVLANVSEPHASVLSGRYLLARPWRDVAESIGYSEDYTRKELHDAALLEAYPYIPRPYVGRRYPAV